MNAPASIAITPVLVADLHVEGERMPVYVHVIVARNRASAMSPSWTVKRTVVPSNLRTRYSRISTPVPPIWPQGARFCAGNTGCVKNARSHGAVPTGIGPNRGANNG